MKQSIFVKSLLAVALSTMIGYADKFMLTVSGPNGYYFQKIVPNMDLSIENFTEDGLYRYEFTPSNVLIHVTNEETSEIDMNGRAKSGHMGLNINKAKTVSGHFRVLDGSKIDNNDLEEEGR